MSRQVYNSTWAQGGTKIDPGAIKYSAGWVVEAPEYEYYNYWQGRTDEMLQHLDRNGIPEYSATTIYEVGGYCREGAVTYRSLVTTNTGNLPSTSPTQWAIAFLVPGNNLSDLASASTARTNLDVRSRAEVDGATTLNNNVIALGKLSQISTARLLGRVSASTGDVESLTATQVRTFLNVEDGASAETAPTGSIATIASVSTPTGYLDCDGAAVNRTTYADLFAEIGTVFGVGNGTTTFNLPDLRGEFIRGWDDSRGVDTGRVFGSSQADAFESHTHTISAGNDVGTGTQRVESANNNSEDFALTSSATGDTETRPRNIALLYCIKY